MATSHPRTGDATGTHGLKALASYDEFRARRSFGSLDGIRCLSIVAVVWHHTVEGVDWFPASKRGFLGVDMFFVLSGFLIVTLLLRERDRARAISLPKFYLRRALRIFPAYYGLLAAMAALFGLLAPTGATAAPFYRELPYYLTYTGNWIELHSMLAISWSLAAEEQFYLLWPPIERFAARIAVPLLLFVIAANQLVNFRLLDGVLYQDLGLRAESLPMLQATFTPICLGVLLAHLLHSRKGFELAARALSARRASASSLAVVVAVSALPSVDISGWQRLLIQLAMATFLCSCVVREDHSLRRILTLPWVARIGAISYGIYLFHPLGRHAADFALRRTSLDFPFALFLACLLATALIAEISYRYYETPFLRLKDSLHGRDEPSKGALQPAAQ